MIGIGREPKDTWVIYQKIKSMKSEKILLRTVQELYNDMIKNFQNQQKAEQRNSTMNSSMNMVMKLWNLMKE